MTEETVNEPSVPSGTLMAGKRGLIMGVGSLPVREVAHDP